jgi:hypothetical protein
MFHDGCEEKRRVLARWHPDILDRLEGFAGA